MYVSIPYFEQVQRDVERDNSLIVFGRGLGMAQALANFVARTVEPGRLIIGINISRVCAVELIWPLILSSLSTSNASNASLLLPRFINSDYSVKDRKEVYNAGGFIVVTSNVLVHDFLHSAIPAERITGLVVFSSESVREGTNDHFAIKLFRMRNRAGFVKAFSELPNRLASGFHKCEKLMRMLYISRLCLWPRFHKSVKSSLRDHVPDLVDLSVPLTGKMGALLNALRDLVSTIFEDLRSATKLIDFSDAYHEEAGRSRMLKYNFDLIVRQQVERAGEKVSWRVRNLVGDLSTLRALLTDVLELNSVLFYQKLMTLRHTSPRASTWLLRKESQTVMLIARSRVWSSKSINRRKSMSESDTLGDDLREKNGLINSEEVREMLAKKRVQNNLEKAYIVTSLEPLPKWQALGSVLEEIQEDIDSAGEIADVGRVLIFVKEKRLVPEIQTVITEGANKYLEEQFKTVFPNMATRAKEDAVLMSKQEQDPFHQTTLTQLARGNNQKKDESNSSAAKIAPAVSFAHNPRKRPRRNRYPEIVPETCGTWDIEAATAADFKEILSDGVDKNGKKTIETLVWCTEWIDLQGRARRIMDEFRPSFVVLFNSNASLVRQTELYKSSYHGVPVRLYILTHADRIEEDVFNNYVTAEKEAFKNLIRERASMAIHDDQEGRRGDEEIFMTQALNGTLGQTSKIGIGSTVSNFDSRRSTSRKDCKGPGKIIVDTRELRSALPMMLHKANVNIIPLTLEVGDFILSKRIGVERKSVPDLYGSFASGRLFNQAEALCQHYAYPCLLIELDSNAPYSLAATGGGIPSEMSITHIISKMVLLVQQFPSLRFLWARGPEEGVKIFMTLKENEEEPDEVTASGFGVDSVHAMEQEFNPGPKALLRSLPGIDGSNLNMVMKKVENVAALTQLSRDEMNQLLGNSAKGKLLYDFVNEEPTEALASI